MKIFAFAGNRYGRLAGEAGPLAAPPFDQIDEALRDRLHASSPLHFSHLTRPVAEGGGDPHDAARDLHAAWLRSGVVEREAEPCLYPYAIDAPGGTRRLGLCCLVGVDPSCQGDLRPHEHTVDKPLAERLSLLERMRVDLEPVLYLSDDDGSLEKLLQEDTQGAESLVSHLDRERGDAHVLFRITDPQRIAQYQAALRRCGAAIADGHHRTKVAQLFAREHPEATDTAAGAKLAVLTSLSSRGLKIDPIHRAIDRALDLEILRAAAVRVEPWAGEGGAAFAAAVDAAPQPALGIFPKGGSPEIWSLDAEAAPADTPGRRAGLAVVLLHHHLLPLCQVGLESASDGTMRYKSDADGLFAMVREGGTEVAVFLPSMSPEAFGLATRDGDVLPPKSTRFLPKLVSGMVWCSHDAKVTPPGSDDA